MTKIMILKIEMAISTITMFLAIQAAAIPGILMSVAGLVYFIEMLRVNVIKNEHGGSWKKYFKSKFKL